MSFHVKSRYNQLIFVITVCFSGLQCTSSIDQKSDYFINSGVMISPIYIHVKEHVKDTIESWIKKDLMYFHQFNVNDKYQIDDYILFNSKLDKCLINLLIQSNYNKVLDDVYFILGEKYEGRWWFYEGPDLTIIQENYIKDTAVYALPFSTLREIARKNTLSWYFIKKPAGTCLKKLFSEGYDSYKKCSDEKYIINDQYFEDEFNYRPNFEARQKDYRERFLKNVFTLDTARLNQ